MAQISNDEVKIGVLTDLSGPYSDASGRGSVLAAEMAAADFGGSVKGKPIKIVSGDTLNKPDIASTIARRWYDLENVDAIVDLPVTPVALAVQFIAKERQRTVMITAAATSDITAKLCSPVSTHWADDTRALTAGTASAIVKRGGKTWFFVTVDHAFGQALQRDATEVIEQNGGKVLGSVRHPLGTSDFSSLVLQAQASKADVIGLASVGGDLTNLIKQANEFKLFSDKRTGAGFLIFITDIHSLGLAVAHDFSFAEGFYWDQNDAARDWAKRFFKTQGMMPTKNHAAIYTAVTHYLKAIEAAGTDDAVIANRTMRERALDYFGRPGSVRQDGRALYDLTLYRVKPAAESKYPWDYYEAVQIIPKETAFLPANPACVGG